MITAIAQTGQSSYPTSNAAAAGGSPGVFQQILQQASSATQAGGGATDTLAADLAAALQAAGIPAPPALRITLGPSGPQLEDDPRALKFEQMLMNAPGLSSRLSERINSAAMARKLALGAAITQFAGDHPSAATVDFLRQFANQSTPDAYGLSFNGKAATVEELGGNGWTPVKDVDGINKDMLAAYTGYMVTHAVTVEKRKDEDGQDAAAAKERLARLLAQLGIASA